MGSFSTVFWGSFSTVFTGPLFPFLGSLLSEFSTKDKWLEIGGRIRPGGYVSLQDDDFLQAPELIRIISVRDYPTKPCKPKIELSNSVIGGTVRSELDKLGDAEVDVDRKIDGAIKLTKRRWRDAQENLGMISNLMDSFNEDIGNLRDEIGDIQFTPPITPITIQTMALLIGDPSLQYSSNIKITYDVQTKVLKMSNGGVVHQTLGKPKAITAGGVAGAKMWVSTSYTSPALTNTSKAYYLYIRASKTTIDAVGFLSEKPKSFADDPEYPNDYNLLVGILSSEYEGERSFAKLYGFMEILPGRITADEMIIQAKSTTIADEYGNKVAIFNGIEGGFAELANVRINGFFQQTFHTQTYTDKEILDLTFSYNVILKPRYISQSAVAVRLPYDDKYNGVVFKMLSVASSGIIIAQGDSKQKFRYTQPLFKKDYPNYASGGEDLAMMATPNGTPLNPQYIELLQVTKDEIIVLKFSEASNGAVGTIF